MKSIAETKFDKVVKLGFHEILKPLGFKKKANNFYSQRNDIGHIINLQKSSYYSKEHIHFTINTGVFLPEYWLAFCNFFNRPVPNYPTEPECILRMRIGELRKENDKWYDVTNESDEGDLIRQMNENLNEYILPHFGHTLSKDMLLEGLDQQALRATPLEKLIVFGELGEKAKAKREFEKLITETTRNPGFLETLKEYGKKYGLI